MDLKINSHLRILPVNPNRHQTLQGVSSVVPRSLQYAHPIPTPVFL
jgi:hypothetical protein